MAQQPQTFDTPLRLPLVAVPENRDETTDKDAKIVNGYAERKEANGQWTLYKRPGRLISRALGAGVARGIYNWLTDIYTVVGTTLYKAGTSLGTVDGLSEYSFSPILGGTQHLFLHNNAKGYNYDSGTGLVVIADPDFPTSLVPGIAYLDGTAYVMTPNAEIYGSDINNTTSWNPLNKIVAQIEPDLGIAIAKQLVYVVAFKQWSTELFYDAANTTGSPLGRVDGAKVSYGCTSAQTIQDIDGTLIWVASNRSSGVQVILMDQLKPTIISTNPIERLLDQCDFTTAVQSWQLKKDGHRFYLLTLKNNNLTIAYDLETKLWHQWSELVDGEQSYMQIQSSTYGSSAIHYILHESNGNIYTINSNDFTDAGEAITWDLYTPLYDGGVRARNKMLSRMDFVADQTSGSALYVRKSDDDYQTWSNFRTVDLSKRHPCLTNCGTFKKRAFNFRHTAATFLRIEAVELQIELGVL